MTAHPPAQMAHRLTELPSAPPSPSSGTRHLSPSTSASSLGSIGQPAPVLTFNTGHAHKPHLSSVVVPPTLERRGSSSGATASAPSSASASKSGSFIGTSRLLSRHSSARERERPVGGAGAIAMRSHSVKGKGREDDGGRSPNSENEVYVACLSKPSHSHIADHTVQYRDAPASPRPRPGDWPQND